MADIQPIGSSSVEVSRYKDGTYGHVVKLYFGEGENENTIIARHREIDAQLRQQFPSNGKEGHTP